MQIDVVQPLPSPDPYCAPLSLTTLFGKPFIAKLYLNLPNAVDDFVLWSWQYFFVAWADMPPGTDCPYPIRIWVFFEMIRPYHAVIRI